MSVSDKLFYKYWPLSDKTFAFLETHDQGLPVSDPIKFNDPFDGAIGFNFDDISVESLAKLLETIPKESGKNKFGIQLKDREIFTFESEAEKIIKEEKTGLVAKEALYYVRKLSESLRMICLTERWNNILMWSHYTDNHKGVVLGFKPPSNTNNNPGFGVPIKYKLKPPSIDEYLAAYEKGRGSDKAFRFIHDLFLLRKHEDWKYEEEYRWIFKSDPYAIAQRYKGFVLKEVVIGLNVEDRLKDKLKKIINLREVKKFKSRQNVFNYSLYREELS